MLLSMYTDVVVNELRSNIKINLIRYANKQKFVNSFIENYDAVLFPLEKDVEYPQLNASMSNKNEIRKQWEIDCENAIKLHKEFILKYNIPLSILSDERFIAYLTHDIYFDYMSARWPIDMDQESKQETRVKEKYFLPSGNQAFTRNMFLRFFWYTTITYDERENDPYGLTKVAFEYADPVNQIMERKYSRNPKIVKAALKAICNVEGSKVLNSRRTLYGKAINNILGMYCLDVLNEKELIQIFETEIKKIIKTNDIETFQDEEY